MALTIQKIKKRKERRKKVLARDLESITRQLVRMGAQKILLFGSYAEGIIRSWSDLDIIAVMPSTRTGKEWMGKIYDEIERNVACDILAFTHEELEKQIPLSRFLRYALENGRVIHETGSEG